MVMFEEVVPKNFVDGQIFHGCDKVNIISEKFLVSIKTVVAKELGKTFVVCYMMHDGVKCVFPPRKFHACNSC